MADELNGHTVTVGAPETTTRVSVGLDGKPTSEAQTSSGTTAISTDSPEDKELEADLEAKTSGEDGEGETGGEEDTAGTKEEPSDTDGTEEAPSADALPDYKADDPEIKSQYEAKYLTVEGEVSKLNFDAFNEELNANYEKGIVDINKGSREFVKDYYGVDDSVIDNYLAGTVLKAKAKDDAIYALAGSEDAYNAMVEWAKADGGYTDDQKVKFNAAMKAGGEEAEAQLALLKARFEKSGGKVPKGKTQEDQPPKVVPRHQRKPSSPAKQVDGSTSAKKVEGFKDREEHRLAMLAAGNDDAKVAEVRKRLRASSWYGN